MREENKNAALKSYYLSLLLPFNVEPFELIDLHTVVINSKVRHIRNLHRFLEKQRKVQFNEYNKVMSLLSTIENCNGRLVDISSKKNFDSIYLRISFSSLEDLEKFDSCTGNLN